MNDIQLSRWAVTMLCTALKNCVYPGMIIINICMISTFANCFINSWKHWQENKANNQKKLIYWIKNQNYISITISTKSSNNQIEINTKRLYIFMRSIKTAWRLVKCWSGLRILVTHWIWSQNDVMSSIVVSNFWGGFNLYCATYCEVKC